MIYKCHHCGKNLTGSKRKWCNTNCQGIGRYYLTKDNPKEKLRRYLTCKRWREKNRAHYNAIVLPKVKIWIMKRYYFRKSKRLCTMCGCKLKKEDKTRCPSCCIKDNIRGKIYYYKRRPK